MLLLSELRKALCTLPCTRRLLNLPPALEALTTAELHPEINLQAFWLQIFPSQRPMCLKLPSANPAWAIAAYVVKHPGSGRAALQLHQNWHTQGFSNAVLE